MEFFYLDKILTIGGLIVFDDLSWPAVRKVMRYAVTNRGYRDESPTPPSDPGRVVWRRAPALVRPTVARVFGVLTQLRRRPIHFQSGQVPTER
jgi:hypothetical protein